MKKLDYITYNKLEGKSPTVVFLSGFKSDMEGSKAIFLENVCKRIGQAFLRFDYSGHGKSGGKFEDGTISLWKQDVLKVIDELTNGELVLVGSSMGAWIMILAALERKERIKSLIGIASAPDFTEDLIWQKFTDAQKNEMAKTGKVLIADCYGNAPYPITNKLIEEGKNHLLLRGKISLSCPIRLLHGMADNDVPFKTSQKIAELIESKDVEIHYVKNADHRFSQPENLQLLEAALLSILGE